MSYKLNKIKSVLKAVLTFFQAFTGYIEKLDKIDGIQQRQPGRAS